MSMNPRVKIVLGIAFTFPMKKVPRTITKYDEDTGKEYQKEVMDYVHEVPAWLKREWQRALDEDFDHHKIGSVGVFPEPMAQEVWFAGRLIDSFDPNEMSKRFLTLDDISVVDRAAVFRQLLDMGMPAETVSIDDIKFQVGVDWV